MTMFLYAIIIGICSFAFYNYFLYVHMNGRLLDLYLRINGEEKKFFLPNDGEISDRYLYWACYKARNYRSTSGDSRKVSVFYFTFEDEYSSELNGTAMHVVIYNVSNDRSRVLHRHFLRTPNGAISELSTIENSGLTTNFSQLMNK